MAAVAFPTEEISLSDYSWFWKEDQAPATEWAQCVSFPTVIHHELEEAGKMEDPFVGLNERLIQWVGMKDWAFRTAFPTPGSFEKASSAVLEFEGLDTVADVILNGKLILQSDNMFVSYRVDVKSALKPEGQTNELYIRFASNAKAAKDIEASNEKLISSMRDSSRLWMRKAQYHWGWDWGRSRLVLYSEYSGLTLQVQSKSRLVPIRTSSFNCSTAVLVTCMSPRIFRRIWILQL